MNKKGISDFLNYLKKNKKLLNKTFSISSRDLVEETDTKVWGVIGVNQKEQLSKKSELLEVDVKHEIKKNQIKAIKILSNTYGKMQIGKNKRKNIDTLMLEKMYSSGQALELFIIDILDRNGKNNIEITSEQIDEKGIDFITQYEKIKFGIQLTYRKEDPEKLLKKKEKIYNLGVSLDYPDKKNPNTKKTLEEDNFSKKQIPDLPVFMTINSEGTQKLYDTINGNGNSLRNSYNNWKQNQYPKGGPIQYLPEILKSDLNFISQNYNVAIDQFLYFIKNIGNGKHDNLNKIYNKNINISENTFMNIKYDPKTYIFSISTKRKNDVIFSLNFNITQKFLKKVGENQNIQKDFINTI